MRAHRRSPPLAPGQAADLAAAALLDSIDAARSVLGADPVVVLTGLLERAARRGARRRRGVSRAGAADRDGHPAGRRRAARRGRRHADRPGVDAVLGLAPDGGWCALGLRRPADARLVAAVPTSRDDTGERTLAALRAGGLRVALLPELVDVDTLADALAVAAATPATRFAAALGASPELRETRERHG